MLLRHLCESDHSVLQRSLIDQIKKDCKEYLGRSDAVPLFSILPDAVTSQEIDHTDANLAGVLIRYYKDPDNYEELVKDAKFIKLKKHDLEVTTTQPSSSDAVLVIPAGKFYFEHDVDMDDISKETIHADYGYHLMEMEVFDTLFPGMSPAEFINLLQGK